MLAGAVVLIAFACGSSAGSEVLEVMVGPEPKECVGVGPMQCMVVDGELFYSRIDGFDYEEGCLQAEDRTLRRLAK